MKSASSLTAFQAAATSVSRRARHSFFVALGIKEGTPLTTLKERLERGETLVAMIDCLRQESGDPNLGADIERMLIDQVIRDLEAESRRFRQHELVAMTVRRPH